MYAYCYLVLREHSQWFGGDSEEVTPVPMPNTEVKLFSADGSRGFPPVRVGHAAKPLHSSVIYGGLAQLGEHLPYKQRVGGSSPSSSTIPIIHKLAY